MKSCAQVFAFALVLGGTPIHAQTVSRAYVDDHNAVHLVYTTGGEKTIVAPKGSPGYDDVAVSSDGQIVGWTVLIDNSCCTSYPVPTSLVLLRGGKRIVITPGQMVWRWRFVEKGDRVAVLDGPVHGWATKAGLYDLAGKLRSTWNGKGEAPEWAQEWKTEFESP